ncbi:MAG: Rpn family recombination-promoting nuclease/putative transposase [Methylococcaceae bacterium]|nr:MAG: Rpn family recombination-promoting nuclease/putative transposase [Methylococcaceae bacterium]
MKAVASLRYGVIFKKAFSDVDVFKGFVRDILGINLEIDKVETEKEFKPTIGHVKIKFDLYAEDKKNHVIVEIQHDRNADHYDRFLHYHCVALLEQVKKSTEYRSNTTVYTIVVLTAGDVHQCDVSTIDFDPKRLDGRPLHEIKHKIIYICPKYVDANTPPLYQEWLQVIDDSLDNKVDESQYRLAEIQKVLLHIEEDGVTPDERARMIDESYIGEAERRGIELGIEQGIAEGKAKRELELAKTMLQEGFDIKSIVKITGLTEAAILQ